MPVNYAGGRTNQEQILSGMAPALNDPTSARSTPTTSPVTIIADTSISDAAQVFGRWGEVRLVDSRHIDRECVAGADALLVRSVTRVDAELLGSSSVRFVGSATIGTDHVDLDWLDREGIAFAHAPGSNAESVVEYVLAAVLATAVRRKLELWGESVGIVGRGNVGRRLERRLRGLGMSIMVSDPPLEEVQPMGDFVPLGDLLEEAAIITLHCPLTRLGRHPTNHLIGEHELTRMRSDALLINTSRGAVVDNAALVGALARGVVSGAVLDVWEGEPTPIAELIEACDLATPHIAGYSVDGKLRGTAMLAQSFARWMGEGADQGWEPSAGHQAAARYELNPPRSSSPGALDAFVRQMYDIRRDDDEMRRLLDNPQEEHASDFVRMRREYPPRHSFSRYAVGRPDSEALARLLAEGLGVEVLPRVAERA